MIDMLLKQMGFDPLKFKAEFSQGIQRIEEFNHRTKLIEEMQKALQIKLDLLLDHAGFDTTKINADIRGEPPRQLIPPTVSDVGRA